MQRSSTIKQLFIAILLLQCSLLSSQDTCYDVNNAKLVTTIYKKVHCAFIPLREKLGSNLPDLPFAINSYYAENVPTDKISKKAIVKFHIRNTADTAISTLFFPGFYYTDIKIYQLTGNSLQRLPDLLPPVDDSIGYRKITLSPHDSITIIAELTLLKTYLNNLRPRLIKPEYINAFLRDFQSSGYHINISSYIFFGLMLTMFLFSLISFIQGGNPEFLYYCGYAFSLGMMLLMKALYHLTANRFNFWMESYFDFVMQGLGHMFYIFFMQRFLATRTQHPLLHKIYKVAIALIIVALISFTIVHYFSDNFVVENMIENITKLLLLGLTLVLLIYGIRHWNDKLLRYLFWGNLCLFVFAVISQLSIMFSSYLDKLPGILSASLFYYELGVILELFFFLAGLNYKNRQQIIKQAKESEKLKAQNLLKEYEKELAVYKAQQEERQRISADMHDELGAGMTAIRLMSEIAKNKMKETTPVEIDKISSSANDVLNKMNAIIWSMNSGNDTLDNLVSYIRSYAQEYLDGTEVSCHINVPDQISPIDISGDKRRNIFLCVKETLNNVLKHAAATAVTIDVTVDDELKIRITDNGKGIDTTKLRQFGNGLKNINRRMESIGGKFSIENENGTVTTLSLPL
jgi:signal transduction histidine kinase